MSKPQTSLDIFHLLSTAITSAEQLFNGDVRCIKFSINDLKMIRQALAIEIDEAEVLREQLKKEREAHKKDNEVSAQNYLQVIKERDGLVDLLALYQKQNEKRPPNPFDTLRCPPIVKNVDCVRSKQCISDRGMAVSADTGNAWDKQVGGEHYKQYAIQPAQFALANNLDYAQSNAIKYIVRHKDKNGVQDLDKAIHYIELLKQHHYNK